MNAAHRPFAERLAQARELLSHDPESFSGTPPYDCDQMRAAAEQTHTYIQDAGRFLEATQPRRGWRSLERAEPLPDQHAYLVAAVLGCVICPHLRRERPESAFAMLPLARLDCVRCVRTFRRPPPGNDDQCDVCLTHGVSWFTPFSCALGPVLVAGDACRRCAAVLLRGVEDAA